MGILCPLVLPMILSLQVVMQAVLIEGAGTLSSQKIEELLDLEEGDPIDEDGLSERIERVLTEYRDLGYIEASINWQFEEGVLHLAIEEGDLYRLGRVEFTGNRFFSSD
jgi:outer membrane protein assembly factor BamA